MSEFCGCLECHKPPAPAGNVQEHTTDEPTITDAEPNVIQRIVNAWDCCATCAGGILAQHVAARVADAVDRERAEITAMYDDWRYCPRCGRAPDWDGATSPGAPCMACGRYPAARDDTAVARERAAWATKVEALADEWKWYEAGDVYDAIRGLLVADDTEAGR